METLLSSVQTMKQTLGTIDSRVSSIEGANAAIASRCERIEAAQSMLASRCDGIEATLKLLADRPRHKTRRQLDGIGDVSREAPPRSHARLPAAGMVQASSPGIEA